MEGIASWLVLRVGRPGERCVPLIDEFGAGKCDGGLAGLRLTAGLTFWGEYRMSIQPKLAEV